MRKVKPVAVLCSDIHLSHTPPISRGETQQEWYASMSYYLYQVHVISTELKAPVIIAGDLFHHWDAPAELINFAIARMPEKNVFAVPGQHDMPLHNWHDLHKSAYTTLHKAGIIIDISCRMEYNCNGRIVRLHPFPFGFDLQPYENKPPKGIDVAVVHKYCWYGSNTYKDADIKNNAQVLNKSLSGFDAAVFGDNHKGFLYEGSINIFNCGCLIPRRIDEKDRQPQVGILMSDGLIKTQKLDNSKDKWVTYTEIPIGDYNNLNISNFIEELDTMKDDEKMSFAECTLRMIEEHDIREQVKKIVLRALERQK